LGLARLGALEGDVVAVLKRGGYWERIGEENFFRSKAEAVRKILAERLDPQRCRSCTARIFSECIQLPRPD